MTRVSPDSVSVKSSREATNVLIEVSKSLSCQVIANWLVLRSPLNIILIGSFCSNIHFIITAVDFLLMETSALSLCSGSFFVALEP